MRARVIPKDGLHRIKSTSDKHWEHLIIPLYLLASSGSRLQRPRKSQMGFTVRLRGLAPIAMRLSVPAKPELVPEQNAFYQTTYATNPNNGEGTASLCPF